MDFIFSSETWQVIARTCLICMALFYSIREIKKDMDKESSTSDKVGVFIGGFFGVVFQAGLYYLAFMEV